MERLNKVPSSSTVIVTEGSTWKRYELVIPERCLTTLPPAGLASAPYEVIVRLRQSDFRLANSTVFRVIDNTAANPISGSFSNLADGGTTVCGDDTLQLQRRRRQRSHPHGSHLTHREPAEPRMKTKLLIILTLFTARQRLRRERDLESQSSERRLEHGCELDANAIPNGADDVATLELSESDCDRRFRVRNGNQRADLQSRSQRLHHNSRTKPGRSVAPG